MPSNRHALMVLIVLAGCRRGQDSREHPRRATHVACIGDSITQGAGASSPESIYPNVLDARFRADGHTVEVGNFGVGGRTMLREGNFPYWTDATYAQAKAFVTGAGADAVVDVVIMLGTNDAKRTLPGIEGANNWRTIDGVTAAQRYKNAYRDMIDELLALTPRPVVYLVLPAPIYTDKYDLDNAIVRDEELPIIHALAAERGLPVIDANRGMTGHPEEFVDGVHPNNAGYVRLAGIIYDGLNRRPAAVMSIVQVDGATRATVAVTPEPVAVARVIFLVDGNPMATVTSSPFTTVLAGLPPGDHVVSATVVDTTGAQSATSDTHVSVAPVARR